MDHKMCYLTKGRFNGEVFSLPFIRNSKPELIYNLQMNEEFSHKSLAQIMFSLLFIHLSFVF